MQKQKSTRRIWTILLILGVAETVYAFESSMIYAAMTTMYRLFDDPVGVGWLITAYFLVSAGVAAVGARLGDIYGRSKVLLAMLVCAGLGSLLSALSEQLVWIVAGRAIQGISAAILPLCFGLVREHLPQQWVPKGVGVIAATAFVGSGVGILLGGLIIDYLSWHWIFYASSVLALLAFVLVRFGLPASPASAKTSKLDLMGGLLFVPAIACILFAITKGEIWGWSDPYLLGLIGAGFAVLAGWVWHELRHPSPLLDVRLLGNPQIALANIAVAFFGLGAMQIVQVLALIMQQPSWTVVGLGLSATVAGLVKTPSSIISAIGAPWSGNIASRHGAHLATLVGAAILTIGWIGLTLFHGSLWIILGLSIVAQLGSSMVYSSLPNMVIEAAPVARTSEATGMLQVTRTLFMAIGAQIVAVTLAISTIRDPSKGPGTYPSEFGFTATYAFIAASCAAVLLIAAWAPARGSAGAAVRVADGAPKQT